MLDLEPSGPTNTLASCRTARCYTVACMIMCSAVLEIDVSNPKGAMDDKIDFMRHEYNNVNPV